VAIVTVGQQAPALDMVLQSTDDQPMTLASLLERGPVLVGLYKSSCQASKTMFPFLQRVGDQYKDRGLQVVGVAQDSPNITQSFARRLDLTMPFMIDLPDYPMSREFDIAATPTVFLIGQDGKVAWTTMGFLKPQLNDLGAAVAGLFGIDPIPVVTDADADVPMFVPG